MLRKTVACYWNSCVCMMEVSVSISTEGSGAELEECGDSEHTHTHKVDHKVSHSTHLEHKMTTKPKESCINTHPLQLDHSVSDQITCLSLGYMIQRFGWISISAQY